jgi:DNA-binding Lrp family transcriptional regulator
MPPVGVPGAGWSLDAWDRRLIDRRRGSLPLVERPFAALGDALALSEGAVIDRLHRLLARGVLWRFGPVFRTAPDPAAPAFAALQVPAAVFRLDLVTATQSGLPLLARPYEAVGAMVGASGERVRGELAAMLAEGLILRIGAVLPADARPPCD